MILRRQANGAAVQLAAKSIGHGGEAQIYPVATDPRLMAKIYHNPTAIHAHKLALMVAEPWLTATSAPSQHMIAWPLDLLVTNDKRAKVVGFLMWRVTEAFPIHKFYTPQSRRVVCPMFTYRYLHRVALNVAAVVHAAHQRGYVIGEINESGALVGNTALVTWVDADSFQIRNPQTGRVYRCGVGKPDFTPPELQGKDLNTVDRTFVHDYFGLAVMIFRLLMEGTHPFDGKYVGTGDPPSLESRIAAGHFPHGLKRVPWIPTPAAPPFAILHPSLQQLLIRTFEHGHQNPKVRTVTGTLMKALQEAEAALVVCKSNQLHVYGNHLAGCPWCQRKTLFGGLDSFPQPGSPQPQWRKTKAQKSHPQTPFMPLLLSRCRVQTTRKQLSQLVVLPWAISGRSPHPSFVVFLIIVGLVLILSRIHGRAAADFSASSTRAPTAHNASDVCAVCTGTGRCRLCDASGKTPCSLCSSSDIALWNAPHVVAGGTWRKRIAPYVRFLWRTSCRGSMAKYGMGVRIVEASETSSQPYSQAAKRLPTDKVAAFKTWGALNVPGGKTLPVVPVKLKASVAHVMEQGKTRKEVAHDDNHQHSGNSSRLFGGFSDLRGSRASDESSQPRVATSHFICRCHANIPGHSGVG